MFNAFFKFASVFILGNFLITPTVFAVESTCEGIGRFGGGYKLKDNVPFEIWGTDALDTIGDWANIELKKENRLIGYEFGGHHVRIEFQDPDSLSCSSSVADPYGVYKCTGKNIKASLDVGGILKGNTSERTTVTLNFYEVTFEHFSFLVFHAENQGYTHGFSAEFKTTGNKSLVDFGMALSRPPWCSQNSGISYPF